MKLSIIIPCFNEEKTIEEIIQLILEQNYKNIELIVVDIFVLSLAFKAFLYSVSIVSFNAIIF